MSDNRRKRRFRDFRRRAQDSPYPVYTHRTKGWRYIPRHPFGDESELLALLSLDPKACIGVDAWWEIGGDAVLVEAFIAATDHAGRGPGVYAGRLIGGDAPLCLYILFDAPFVTRTLFEAGMQRCAELGVPSRSLYGTVSEKRFRKLGTLKEAPN